ncbi:unnamed protein product [Xylocopa violacea]|uniref:Uncharacterized protein n=1 Tax=Xylocopa violacea TaxID=135666 RepID=A0ABP1P379_XYLVO
MHRVLIVWLAIGWCKAIAVPIDNDDANSELVIQHQENSKHRSSATSRIDDQQQLPYSSLTGGNQVPVNRYVYPIYPEYSSNGYTRMVQTGYDDFFAPTTLVSRTVDTFSFTEIAASLFALSGEILTYLAHFLFVVLLGSTFMTIICTFTSICAINFLGFSPTENQVKEQVAELARSYVSTEAVNAATLLVSRAVEEYVAMRNKKYENVRTKEVEGAIRGSSTADF